MPRTDESVHALLAWRGARRVVRRRRRRPSTGLKETPSERPVPRQTRRCRAVTAAALLRHRRRRLRRRRAPPLAAPASTTRTGLGRALKYTRTPGSLPAGCASALAGLLHGCACVAVPWEAALSGSRGGARARGCSATALTGRARSRHAEGSQTRRFRRSRSSWPRRLRSQRLEAHSSRRPRPRRARRPPRARRPRLGLRCPRRAPLRRSGRSAVRQC
jgi:hypothetical protein